jgi:superfamily II DNA helicase RecQ
MKKFGTLTCFHRLDIRDVQLVVHIGCPKSILSYWQEAGRCARDGRLRFSLILYDGFTLALKITDKAMAAVVKNDSKTCIRKLILETLGDENMSMSQTSSVHLGYLIPFLKQRTFKDHKLTKIY